MPSLSPFGHNSLRGHEKRRDDPVEFDPSIVRYSKRESNPAGEPFS